MELPCREILSDHQCAGQPRLSFIRMATASTLLPELEVPRDCPLRRMACKGGLRQDRMSQPQLRN